jgi:hypothetical protein
MKTKDLDKLTKQELFKMLNDTAGKLDRLKKEDPWNKKVPIVETEKKKIRRVLYECLFCADAQIETITDKHGNEKDFIKRDCGLKECPYHEYFISKTKEDDARIKKLIKLFFKNA